MYLYIYIPNIRAVEIGHSIAAAIARITSKIQPATSGCWIRVFSDRGRELKFERASKASVRGPIKGRGKISVVLHSNVTVVTLGGGHLRIVGNGFFFFFLLQSWNLRFSENMKENARKVSIDG